MPKILDAALEFILSHPFRDMTVNSLMASTGLSRSAFWQNINDLQDLIESLLEMLSDEVFDVAQIWISTLYGSEWRGNGTPNLVRHESREEITR